ncbi:MAG: homoserine dehydrogenase [Erysipelothrix sp.]|nr:homoserine dehydrogenase [Erysipelothrix sp.]
MKVCVCGYGVVGQGVVEILDRKDKDKVRYIFTRELLEDPRHVVDFMEVLKDPEVKIIVEAMGGLDPAFQMMENALKHEKHVVTSNKELVEKYGSYLNALAKKMGVHFMFEASVGGGIPLISTLRHGLGYEDISQIKGILNGTSNYILTNMIQDGISFEVALKDAMDKGYAEKDPTDDIEGYDTARKIAILGSILLGKEIDFKDIDIKGIVDINEDMITYAQNNKLKIKLIASVEDTGKDVFISVAPTLIDQTHPFYSIDGVDNAVLFKGQDVGEVMVKGAGAGRYPTASAMVSDVYALDYKMPSTVFWTDEKVDVKYKDDNVLEFKNSKYEKKHKSEVDSKYYLSLGG